MVSQACATWAISVIWVDLRPSSLASQVSSAARLRLRTRPHKSSSNAALPPEMPNASVVGPVELP